MSPFHLVLVLGLGEKKEKRTEMKTCQRHGSLRGALHCFNREVRVRCHLGGGDVHVGSNEDSDEEPDDDEVSPTKEGIVRAIALLYRKAVALFR